MVISRTKAELNRPQTDSRRPETGAVDQHTISKKSDSSDATPNPTPTREVRYQLSRTSDTSGSRRLTPPDKAVSVSSRSELAGGRGSTAGDLDISGRSERTLSDTQSLKGKEKEFSSMQETKSVTKSEGSLDKKVEIDRNERTRSPDDPISENLRQSSESEYRKSMPEQHDSEAEIEDAAKTAEDLSVSEESVARTASKSSFSEEKSRSSRKSLSAGRGQISDSDRRSSAKISDEAKTAEDLSASEGSEIVTRTKSSRSESSVRGSYRKSATEKSKDEVSEQSNLVDERKSIVSEVSKSSRLTNSQLPEKSRSSRPAYSSSFESVHSEEDRTEDDVSEHISIEESLKEYEADRSTQEHHLERTVSKDGESNRDISEVPEDVSGAKDEKSEIEEELPSAGRGLSDADENSGASQRTERSLEKGKDFLKPEINEDQLPSYSADFEPSALDETDEGKSDNLRPQASYSPDFDTSGSNAPKEHDQSLQEKEELEDLSGYSKEIERSEISKGEDKKHVAPEIPTVALEQATDEESIAEELSEHDEGVREIGNKEDSNDFYDKNDFEERLLGAQQRRGDETTPVLPEVTSKAVETPEARGKHSDQQIADRIAQELSAMLLTESMNCVTNMLERRLRTAEVGPKAEGIGKNAKDTSKASEYIGEKAEDAPKASEDSGNIAEDAPKASKGNGYNKRREERTSFKDDEDVFRWLVEKETPEAEIIFLSEGEESVSELDFRSKEQEDLIPKSRSREDLFPSHVDKPLQDLHVEQPSRGEQGDSIVKKLSDSLLKEAASQMIAIMRAKQAKRAATQKEQSTDSPSSPIGTTEDEPHSGEESPLLSPRSSRLMAVQRFPDGVSKFFEDTVTPPGSPTGERRSSIDEKELADKLDQLRRLHEHLDSAREQLVDDDDDRLEFTVHTNKLIDFPAEEEDEEEEVTRRSRATSFLFSVPHRSSEVSPVVASSLSFYFDRKRRGLPVDVLSPPSKIIGEDEADDDLEANSKRVYRRLVFDLSGNVLKELLAEEAPSNRPSWMKANPRRKRRFHRGSQPLVHEKDYLPVVEQQVLNLIGLGDARPSLDRVRRKTPLKAGKKDFVDAILIQELREEEPLWIDYDDDELAVKFQVADAIFESLLSETAMVVNAVQMRREARMDALPS